MSSGRHEEHLREYTEHITINQSWNEYFHLYATFLLYYVTQRAGILLCFAFQIHLKKKKKSLNCEKQEPELYLLKIQNRRLDEFMLKVCDNLENEVVFIQKIFLF